MAISANELRIGNYVTDHLGRTQKVAETRSDAYICYLSNGVKLKYKLNTTQPIPLTEEWLLKLGLKRGGYDMIEVWHPDKPRFVMVGYLDDEEDNDYLGWNYNHEGTTEEEYGSSRIYIRYVHQLQNLYFALCGEELKLN